MDTADGEKRAPASRIIPESDVADVERIATNLKLPDFKIVYQKDGIRIDTQRLKSGLCAIRARAVISNCLPETMFRMLNEGFDYVGEYDNYCADWRVLEEIDPVHSVTYYRLRSPVPLLFKPRDFVLARFHKKFSDDKFVMYGRSIDSHPNTPPMGRKKVVRAFATHNFFMMTRDSKSPKNTIFNYYSQADIGGRIPRFLVNWISKRQAPKMIIAFRKAAHGYLEWKAAHPSAATAPPAAAAVTEVQG